MNPDNQTHQASPDPAWETRYLDGCASERCRFVDGPSTEMSCTVTVLDRQGNLVRHMWCPQRPRSEEQLND